MTLPVSQQALLTLTLTPCSFLSRIEHAQGKTKPPLSCLPL